MITRRRYLLRFRQAQPWAPPTDPWRTLAAAILYRAYLDWRRLEHCRPNDYELVLFFGGPWFATYCHLLDLDPDFVRRRLKMP